MAVRPNSPQHPVAAAPPAGGLALAPQGAHTGKPSLPLTRAFTLIGSRNRAHLHLVSPSVSKSHTAVIATQSGIYVRDLASRTHTIVNGRPQRESDLNHGDKLAIGNFSFRVEAKGFAKPKFAPESPKAVLAVVGADFPIPFEGRTLLIGRRPTCDVPLVEESVSTVHALIFEADGGHYVRDLGSRTGTLVNGKPVHQHPLSFGDELRVGDTVMRYASEAGAAEHFEEDLAGTARLSDATEEPVAAPRGFAPPPPIPQPAARTAEPVAPASEADDLDLIPLAADDAEAEAAPVGNWDRVRTPAPVRPAEPEPAVAEAADAIPLEADEAPAEPVVAEAPIEEIPAEDLIDFDVPAEELALDAEPAAEVSPVSPAEVAEADVDEALGLSPAVEEAAADEEPAALETAPETVAESAEGFDDLGLEFGESAEPETAKAPSAEELGELDLSGLTLEPVAADADESRPTAEDLGLESDVPQDAASEEPTPLLDLGVAPPLAAEAPAAAEETPAPAPKKSRKKPAAKKDKPAAATKKDKQSWWGKKRKQQQGEPQVAEAAPAADEPLAPLAPAAAAATAAAGAAALAPGDESITGDDLAFLDEILGAETIAAADVAAPAVTDEPLTADDDAAPVVAADASIDLATADDAEAAMEFAPPEPVDSLAGLDFSNLATGSGLDLGGVVDTVELSPAADADAAAEAESVLPPTAPDLAPAEAESKTQDAALDFAPAEAELDRAPAEAELEAQDDALDLASAEAELEAKDEAFDLTPAAEAPRSAEDDNSPAAATLDLADDESAPAALAPEASDEDVEPVTAEFDAGEVLDVTEPTPESALDLELPETADASAEDVAPVEIAADLSDTTFGRAVESMTDPALEPVVEGDADSAATTAPAADVWTEAEEPAPAEVGFAEETEASVPVVEDEAATEPVEVAAESEQELDDDAFSVVSAEESTEEDADAAAPAAGSASPDLAFDDMLDEVLGSEAGAAEAEPALRFDLDAAPAPAPHVAPAAAAEGDDETALAFEQPAAESDEWHDAAAVAEVSEEEDAEAAALVANEGFTDESADAPSEQQQAAAALEDAAASDELSDDTLAVAEPEPGAEAETAAFAEPEEADELALAEPPPISEFTPAAEDEAAPAEAVESLAFDLDDSPAESPQAAAAVGEEEAVDLDALSPDDRAALTGDVDAAALETVDAEHATAPPAEAEAPKVDTSAIRPFDPYFGMGRDLGSFIGGMPLSLPPAQDAAFGQPARSDRDRQPAQPAAQAPEPAEVEAVNDDVGATLDELSLPAADELEVPSSATDLDADIEAIDFTSEPADDEVVAPATPTPAAEAPPVAPSGLTKGRSIPKPPPPAKNIPPRQAPPAGRAVAHSPFDMGLGDSADGSVEIPPFDRATPGGRPKARPADDRVRRARAG